MKSATDRICVFLLTFGSRKVVRGDDFKFIAHMCNLTRDASTERGYGADGAAYYRLLSQHVSTAAVGRSIAAG